MEFNISQGRPAPIDLAETVITYDPELMKWFIYTDYAPHALKWENKIIPSDIVPSRKVYHEDSGQLIAIEGEFAGSVSLAVQNFENVIERKV
ncbi:hypothetical protein QP860_03510 [Aerococcus sp. UMB1112A]|uniref:hypothetical protein n=1 Tax=Aerococcus sp. UMB1112A TaxID=3050609 RepID=UPI00254DDBB4|nr:hypothetical protein [Aerococcus sp. UMB1112A]MDK8502116.1 hypothetical protein [Aerococcus sp. UMB1112A]